MARRRTLCRVMSVRTGRRCAIIRGGFNVYPREIEEVLITRPAVSMAAVVGVPHATHGEDVEAFVIPCPARTCARTS
ncbi:hypothetical protein [Streptomyces sp. NPDC088180]|uniref:AMP-binding enzyme n=1 Tax=Streptomyces sp. NPDC088180 TaxID=3365837 RepID=UPI0037F8A8DD